MHENNPNLKRQRSLNSLERIRQKKDEYFTISNSCVHYPYFYDVLFRGFVKETLIDGFYDEESRTNIPPLEEVADFFGKELEKQEALKKWF